MCGLAGFLNPSGLSRGAAEIIEDMTARLRHRGPDNAGTWIDHESGIALGHRRLSVLDLSAAGDQPMVSESARFVISFNGEIYNHLESRSEIDNSDRPAKWRGHSDTETLLAMVERWGIESALQRSVGMFALAIWDNKERVLSLARDRFGEKPLYYGWQGDVLLFGSELKSLRAHPEFRSSVDRDVLSMYMRHGYIQAPCSIFRGIRKVVPGTIVSIRAGDQPGTDPDAAAYWSFSDVAARGLAEPMDCGAEQAVDLMESRLREAVQSQCIADVPVGAFLSGGIDSSTVVALMQAQSGYPVRSFTIGFDESQYDEAVYARSVARFLGTDHTEFYVTPARAMDTITHLPAVYDEPFGDSSAVPTALVSQITREHVTVSLSGDGGDELFGGYTRYQRVADIWTRLRRFPRPLRTALSAGVRLAAKPARGSQLGHRTDRLTTLLSAGSVDECYRRYVTQRINTCALVPGSNILQLRTALPGSLRSEDRAIEAMMYADTISYLPDDILTKVDRAAMHVSLETRVPMLDHRVVELAWRLPPRLRRQNGQSKWILRQILRRYIPDDLIERPKMGFGIPIAAWLRGPLRDWAESLLDAAVIRQQGFLEPALVRREWSHYLNGVTGSGDRMWQILMFQAWLCGLKSV